MKTSLISETSLTRRSFIAGLGGAGLAVGTLGFPVIFRAASRPVVTHGLQAGDVTMSSGVV